DSIDLALRTTGGRFRNHAIPAGVAGAMHVEKSYPIAFVESLSFDIEYRSAYFAQAADRDMAWNQWIRNLGEAALLQINISTADFRTLNFQQRRILLEFGSTHVAQFDGRIRLRDNSNFRHEREG